MTVSRGRSFHAFVPGLGAGRVYAYRAVWRDDSSGACDSSALTERRARSGRDHCDAGASSAPKNAVYKPIVLGGAVISKPTA